ncbi:copper homeostasis protein CutC [Xaviernesmea oryzae]|uniref:PF03932 family protein CutC n=1 Tax=Xaviernesmea oryzae TaxID=464029 RepID=A0A1Q9AS35_9HYPH|nr:copper homeostasis protein CutC [Xaviernesmea oryzae]OLP58220.1 copper homeostasis protein CutC [Xaviernesmea oryzae]SEL46122.1 copper homeostasis protein [Xaviernesmea oryzae]
MAKILLEVCVDSAEGLEAAIDGGADRIELCAALECGGLTPSPGLMRLAAQASIPVYAMIRPRPGDFVFSTQDETVMRGDLEAVGEAGLAGVVLGANRRDGSLDGDCLSRLSDAAGPLGRTLHRAFDLAGEDFPAAVDVAVALGFERILTSGGAPAAPQALDALAAIFAAAAGRIVIMPGSGLSPATIGPLLARLDPREVHASCGRAYAPHDPRAAALGFVHAGSRMTDRATVRALKALLNAA